jgi:hypothetical protein
VGAASRELGLPEYNSVFIKLWLDVGHSALNHYFALWLIEADVFQLPQLHKHLIVICNQFPNFIVAFIFGHMMPFNQDKTQSFEYRRNDCCHKILNKLYRRLSPIMREGTLGNSMKGIEGKITSNSLSSWVDTSELVEELNEPDHFILDCCEHLWRNNHVEVLRKNVDPDIKDSGIIYQVMFTKHGLDAFKTDYYLKENQKQDWATQIHNSTLFNNRWTPKIAALAFFIALFTFINELVKDNQEQVSQRQFLKEIQQIDSSRNIQVNELSLLLKNNKESSSYKIDTAKAKQ